MKTRVRRIALLLALAVLCLPLLPGCAEKEAAAEWIVSEFVVPSGYSVTAVRGRDPDAGTVTVFAHRNADGSPCLLTVEEDGRIRGKTALPGADRLIGLTWLPDGGFMGIRDADEEQIAQRYGPDGSPTGSFSASGLLAPFMSGASASGADLSGTAESAGTKRRTGKERIFMLSDGSSGLVFSTSSALYFCPGPADLLFEGGQDEASFRDGIRAVPLPEGIRSEDPPLRSPDGLLFLRWITEDGQRGAFFDPETGDVTGVFPLPRRTRVLGFDGLGCLLFTEGGGIMALSPAEDAPPAARILSCADFALPRNVSACLLPEDLRCGGTTIALFWEGAKDPEAARRREGESDRTYAARTALLPRQTRILVFRRPA